MIRLGALILLLVVYQLWGTGIHTSEAQDRLRKQFEQEQAALAQSAGIDPGADAADTPSTLPIKVEKDLSLRVPKPGDPIGIIDIPRISSNFVFVEGVDLQYLSEGPGHYPGTPLPGQEGNAAIAGHRTTHGAPFYYVDHLAVGDKIYVQTFAGKYTYVVYKTPFAVKPTAYYVVNNTKDAELTLTSCNPRYSAAERIVIKARLVREQSDKPHKPPTHINGRRIKPPKASQLSTALKGQANSKKPTVLLGILVAIVGLLWWWAFRRWRHPLTWLAGVVPFLIVLFPFYVYLERALPNGY